VTTWRDPVARALAGAVLVLSLSRGLFYAVSALYFTRSVGLSASTVGVGLTLAGAAGVLASYLGGHLSDRFGADRVQQWALGAHGLALLAYAGARDVITFVLIAACVSGSRGLLSTAQMTMLARWYTGPERVTIRATLRAIMNVAIGAGTLMAGLALMVDTPAAYRLTMALVGVLTTLGTLPLVGLRRRVPGLAARMDARSLATARTRSALRDRTYVGATALTSLMALQFGLTAVGIPLWVADHTEAPTSVISVLLLVNTVYVALFQVRASKGTDDIRVAGRAVRRAGLLLVLACMSFAVAARLGPAAATGTLVVAAVAAAVAETLSEAGSWGLAFELADPDRAGEYQGVSQLGYALAQMLAPAVVTLTAIDHGTPGWLTLAALFMLAGVATAALARRAATTRAVTASTALASGPPAR
jgi:MFS family permease